MAAPATYPDANPVEYPERKPVRLTEYDRLHCTWDGGAFRLWGWRRGFCVCLMEHPL